MYSDENNHASKWCGRAFQKLKDFRLCSGLKFGALVLLVLFAALTLPGALGVSGYIFPHTLLVHVAYLAPLPVFITFTAIGGGAAFILLNIVTYKGWKSCSKDSSTPLSDSSDLPTPTFSFQNFDVHNVEPSAPDLIEISLE